MLRLLSCFIIAEPDVSFYIFNVHLLQLLLEELDFGLVDASALVVGRLYDGALVLALELVQVVDVRSANWSVDHNQLLKVSLHVAGTYKLDICHDGWGYASVQVVLQPYQLLLVWRQEAYTLVVGSTRALHSQACSW